MGEKYAEKPQSHGVILPVTNDPSLCPVTAYCYMKWLVPTRRKTDPLIMFKDCDPVPLSFVQGIWNRAMEVLQKNPKRFLLHGLFRGGATYLAFVSSNSRKELQDAGRWCPTAYQ